jgi:hypothetical protein
VVATHAALSRRSPTLWPAERPVWHGTVDPWADRCGAAPCVRTCGLAGSGRVHGIQWIGCGQIHVWPLLCRGTPPWISGMAPWCSTQSPIGAAARQGLANGEGLWWLVNTPPGDVWVAQRFARQRKGATFVRDSGAARLGSRLERRRGGAAIATQRESNVGEQLTCARVHACACARSEAQEREG